MVYLICIVIRFFYILGDDGKVQYFLAQPEHGVIDIVHDPALPGCSVAADTAEQAVAFVIQSIAYAPHKYPQPGELAMQAVNFFQRVI